MQVGHEAGAACDHFCTRESVQHRALCAGTVPHAAQLQAHFWKSIDALTHKPSDHAQRSNEHAGRTRHPIIITLSVLAMARVSRASYALSPPHCANEHEWLGQT